MPPDKFPTLIKEVLAKRVANRCSRPDCGAATSGPHTDPSRAINLGVAAHIAAASPGGPRFDENQTTEERRSIDNAIWLCQTCAKLIDSDEDRYSANVLRAWKVRAEGRGLREIEGPDSDFYPQPDAARHLPLPRIGGLFLGEARTRILNAGWQPKLNHWSYAHHEDIKYGNGPWLWQRGFHEVVHAYSTGLAYCTLMYRDAYGNELKVVTAGEPEGDDGDVVVWSWSLQSKDSLETADRTFTRLSVQLTHDIQRANRLTQEAMRARRDLAIAAGGIGGAREQLYRQEAESRLSTLTNVESQLTTIKSGFSPMDPDFHLRTLEKLTLDVEAICDRASGDKVSFEAERVQLRRG